MKGYKTDDEILEELKPIYVEIEKLSEEAKSYYNKYHKFDSAKIQYVSKLFDRANDLENKRLYVEQ